MELCTKDHLYMNQFYFTCRRVTAKCLHSKCHSMCSFFGLVCWWSHALSFEVVNDDEVPVAWRMIMMVVGDDDDDDVVYLRMQHRLHLH